MPDLGSWRPKHLGQGDSFETSKEYKKEAAIESYCIGTCCLWYEGNSASAATEDDQAGYLTIIPS
jgi:hypothetical protein